LRFEEVSIYESPFYISLVNNDRKVYDEYRDYINKNTSFVCCAYEEFTELYKTIRDNGYDQSQPIKVSGSWKRLRSRVVDGQHRAAILLFIDESIKVRCSWNSPRVWNAFPIYKSIESLQNVNGKRPSEIHTIIAWDGKQDESTAREYVKNELNKNFEIVYQDLIEVNHQTQLKLAKSVYGGGEGRVKNGHLYLIVVKDNNPTYKWQRATSCKQVLNVNMKFIKEDMREKIGGSRNAYFSIHTSYNTEEALMVLEPLSLQHLIERPTFDNFRELFDMLNNDDNLEYVVQRSFHELENSPSFFKIKDVDVLVNDYYYFKSITGARSVNKKLMRENDNGYHIQSKINIGGIEVPFDIRFTGDDFVDSVWEWNMLDRRILHKVNDEIEIYTPNKEDELYSLLYNILVQKYRPKRSKHIPRLNFLRHELHQEKLRFGRRFIKFAWDVLKTYMNENGYLFKKPVDKQVRFRQV
jgi:hypothetical protein